MRLAVLVVLLAACGTKRAGAPTGPQAPAPVPTTAPADARAWYLKAVVAEAAGESEEARRAMAWVVRMDRNSPWSWLAKGRLLEREGDLSSALEAYAESLSRAPLPDASLAMGRVRLKSGDRVGSVEPLTAAANAGLSEGVILLARALAELDRPDEAVAWLVDWAPTDPADQTTRAALLTPVAPGAAAEAWWQVVDVDEPALHDAQALLGAAAAACRSAEVLGWLEQRQMSTWGEGWAALIDEASDAPECTQASP